MVEENSGTESAPGLTGTSSEAAAMHAALSGASQSAEAREFLGRQSVVAVKQAQLLDLQIADMTREDTVRHWSIRVRHVSDVMKLAFEFAVAAILLAVVVVIGAAVWNAAHDNGLVIEAFSVPPDMAARGLTGQAVAADLQDKLTAMQNATDSGRPANSYANNWGDDIKVQIPDTGVSIGEFYRILVLWLGHQTHITGEIYRDADGVSIVARAGADGGTPISGRESDFGKLMQQAAEAIYARTQPYRYAVYIFQHRQIEKARASLEAQTEEGSPTDKAWAWIGLASIDELADPTQAPAKERKALALDPGFALAWNDLSYDELSIGHDEMSLADARKILPLLQSGNAGTSERARRMLLAVQQSNNSFAVGDFTTALRFSRQAAELPDYSGAVEYSREQIIISMASLHDAAAANDATRQMPASHDLSVLAYRAETNILALYWLHDWASVVARRRDFENDTKAMLAVSGVTQKLVDVIFTRQVWPYIATAQAMTGDLRGAQTLIDKTPLDCYACLRNRGDIDSAEGNWRGAGYWFARAVAAAPSIPMAYTDWGQMLLTKGDTGGAIAKFTLANQKGPHYADPLEMWGEALVRENRSDLALAKFEEADKYAPNWGRLHLKWGEALLWSGKKDEAQKQFAIAAGFDLSPSGKSELTRVKGSNG